MRPGSIGAPQKIEGDCMIVCSKSIELEPEYVGCKLSDALD